jgi:SAM-dependent methyltransferase
MVTNTYSEAWFRLFLERRPSTAQEIAFITRNLPNPPYRKVLDLGCGQGRHTNPLARAGFEMLGIDLNEAALATARRQAPASARYLLSDMAAIDRLPDQFDGILSMWQSFGYFDEQGNREMLAKISRRLATRGRFILDIYHREYWMQHQGEREIERNGTTIKVTESLQGNRLTARVDYGSGEADVFEWQLFTPAEIRELAEETRMKCLRICTEYDERKPASSDKPMMQFVFERRD